MKRISFLSACVWLMTATAGAQMVYNLDSLLRLLPNAPDDSTKVDLYINIGQQYESNQPEVAKYYYKQAGLLSQRLGMPSGYARYIHNYTYVLNMQGKLDSGLLLNQEAIRVSREAGDSLNLAKALTNTGTSFRNLSIFDSAAYYYEQARRMVLRQGNKELEANISEILQVLYKDLGQYDKAIELGEKAVRYFRKEYNPTILAIAASNLGMSYALTGQYGKAEALYREAIALADRHQFNEIKASTLLNLGDLQLRQGRYAAMKPYFDEAIRLYDELDGREGMLVARRGMALYYMSQQDYARARSYALEALQIANDHHISLQRQKMLEVLSNIHYALHDMRGAEEYARQSALVADSILNDRIQEKAVEMDRRLEAEKRELEIRQLQTEAALQQLKLKQNRQLNYWLLGGLGAIIAISLLGWRNYRHRQALQQQRINELEAEKQLAAAEAVLKGEEQERTRLARELHDGLGGMLSGVKFSLQHMTGDMTLSPEGRQNFERSIDLLDNSIQEMRRVAHNMMPESLLRFGLEKALSDFCNNIRQAGQTDISLHTSGLDAIGEDRTTAIAIYRILQELINNALKHAGASEILVQATVDNGRVSLTVEDNGVGFDATKLAGNEGIGLSNVRSRVNYLKGILDIRSKPGEGSSVYAEWTLPEAGSVSLR